MAKTTGIIYVISCFWQDETIGCGHSIIDAYLSRPKAERELAKLQKTEQNAAVTYHLTEVVMRDMFSDTENNAGASVVFEYLYRDGSNYKRCNRVVLAGNLSRAEIDEIIGYLNDGEYFIPYQVGLPEERFEETTDDDHIFFELRSSGILTGTTEPPTITMTARELLCNFRKVAGKWDVVSATSRLEGWK